MASSWLWKPAPSRCRPWVGMAMAWGALGAWVGLVACGGSEGDGSEADSGDGGVDAADGGEEVPVCEERSLFRFAIGSDVVSVLRAGDGDPFAAATRIRAQAYRPDTGQLVDEADVPVGQGATLALTSQDADTAQIVVSGVDDGDAVLAQGEARWHRGAPVAVAVVERPAWWTEFLRESCEATQVAQGRLGHTATPLPDGRILVAGGVPAPEALPFPADAAIAGAPLAGLEVFDPSTGEVTEVGTLPAPMAFHTASALSDGTVLLAGGLTGTEGALLPSSSTWIVDPASAFEVTVAAAPLAAPRAHHAAVELDGGNAVFIVGGNLGGGGAEQWTPAGSTLVDAQVRSHHTLTYIAELNTIVAAGGELPGGQMATSYELFDATGQPPFSYALYGLIEGTERTLHSAAWLPSAKRLYLVGGFRDAAHTQATSSLLVWDPVGQTFQLDSVSLSTPRGAAVAVPLPGQDTIVVAGGYGAGELRTDAEAIVVLPAVPPSTTPQTAVASAAPPPAPFFGAAAALVGSTWRVWPGGGGQSGVWAYVR